MRWDKMNQHRGIRRRQRFYYWKNRSRAHTPSAKSKKAIPPNELSNILAKLNEFRLSNKFCDGQIISADEKIYNIHRNLLASCSDYFHAAFNSPLSKDTSTVKLEFPSEIVECIIEFCYTGKCNITEGNVQAVLPAADKIGIVGLIDFSCNFLQNKLTINNMYGIFLFASIYGCKRLADSSWNMMLKDFALFMDKSEEFRDMVLEDLESLLRSPYLNLSSETLAFLAVKKWIMAKQDEREGYANRLWSSIRYSLIPLEFYRKEVLSTPYIDRILSQNLWDALNSMNQCGDGRQFSRKTRIPYSILFAVGGWARGTPTNCMETYNIRADRWFRSNLYDTIPRAYHSLVLLDNLIYMIGGFDGTRHFSSVRCFDPVNMVWSEKACMHRQRCYVSCVVVGKEIYALGGFNGMTRMKSVERYSVGKNQWYMAPCMNNQRSDCGAVAVGNKIYVIGGYNGQEILDSTEYYDIETKMWYNLPSLNTRRSGVCLVYYRDHIYAIGGFNGDIRLNTIERLNILRPTLWHMDIPRMITQRSNFASVVLEDKIYVVGGFNGHSTISNCEYFDGEKWCEISHMNINRSALSLCVCEGLRNWFTVKTAERIES